MSIWNILRKHDEYFHYVWTFVNYVARNSGKKDNAGLQPWTSSVADIVPVLWLVGDLKVTKCLENYFHNALHPIMQNILIFLKNRQLVKTIVTVSFIHVKALHAFIKIKGLLSFFSFWELQWQNYGGQIISNMYLHSHKSNQLNKLLWCERKNRLLFSDFVLLHCFCNLTANCYLQILLAHTLKSSARLK